MARLFGTDGIRGIANEELTPELAYKVGRAGAYILSKGEKGKILVGKDTRISGDMLESALMAGITSMGIDKLYDDFYTFPAQRNCYVTICGYDRETSEENVNF